jgi:hypothetical protein
MKIRHASWVQLASQLNGEDGTCKHRGGGTEDSASAADELALVLRCVEAATQRLQSGTDIPVTT